MISFLSSCFEKYLYSIVFYLYSLIYIYSSSTKSRRSSAYDSLLDESYDPLSTTTNDKAKNVNYSKDTPLSGATAILLASKFCRQSQLYPWSGQMLSHIGKRCYKHSCLVDLLDLSGNQCDILILSMVSISIYL